jgi:hypothetical protein
VTIPTLHPSLLPKTTTPEPCLRCGDTRPLTISLRDELFFYTARMSLSLDGSRVEIDTDRQPRGRLCEACTHAFVGWLR